MRKSGSYNVNEDNVQTMDNSLFKKYCTCAVLAFIVICVTLLVGLTVFTRKEDVKEEKLDDKNESEEQIGVQPQQTPKQQKPNHNEKTKALASPSASTLASTSASTLASTSSPKLEIGKDNFGSPQKPTLNLTSTITSAPTSASSPKLAIGEDKNTSTPSESISKVTKTSILRRSATKMLSAMNHDADPCDDFYDFSCGNWEESNPLLEDDIVLQYIKNNISSTSDKYLKEFQTFYDSCIEHNSKSHKDRVKGVKEIVERIGTFYVNEEAKIPNITEFFAEMTLRQSLMFFDIGLDVDVDQGTNKYILQLTLPSESALKNSITQWPDIMKLSREVSRRDIPEIFRQNVNLHTVYENIVNNETPKHTYFQKINYVVQGEIQGLNKENTDIRSLIDQFLTILEKQKREDPMHYDVVNKKFIEYKVSDLQQTYGGLITWRDFFSKVTNKTIKNDPIVQVYFQDYFKQLFDILNNIPHSKIYNFLLATYAYNLYETTVISNPDNIEKYCLQMSKELMPQISNYIIRISNLDSEIENKYKTLQTLFNNLKQKLSVSFSEAKWLTDEEKSSLQNRSLNLELKKADEQYENELDSKFYVVNLSKDKFQNNLDILLKFYRQSVSSLHGSELSTKTIFDFFLNSAEEEPLTFYGTNIVAVPLGLVKKATTLIPSYISMASIGWPLAKSILRHFDPIGKSKIILPIQSQSYDDLINHSSFGSNMQYHNRNVSFNEFPIKLSANERMIENGAFRLLWQVLKIDNQELMPWINESYSNPKLFFIAVAQELCEKPSLMEFMFKLYESELLPGALRVENIMVHSSEYLDTFLCNKTSRMNREGTKNLQFPNLLLKQTGISS